MTGWRLGYIAAPVEIAKAIDKLQGQFTSATSSITQRAAIEALGNNLKPTADMLTQFVARRKRVLELVKDIPGLVCNEPEGAFYIFPNVKSFFGKKTPDGQMVEDADALCMYLLNDAHVSSV